MMTAIDEINRVLASKKEAIRDGFGEGLAQAGRQDPRVVALCADLTASCRMDIFKEQFPQRFVEIGVAEQNMIGVAAGMARIGFIPFAGSFAAFSPGRSFDQIRVSVCYSQANVKIYGGHAGLTVGEDGATHQMLEDIAMMRALPGMTVFVPCDRWQAYHGTLALATMVGPAYIRGSRAKVPSVTGPQTPFTLGAIDVLSTGTDVTIVACGVMVAEALRACVLLAAQGICASVLNAHTIKPFDALTLLRHADTTGCVVVAEEHQVAGGLFSVVCEVLAQRNPLPVESVAVLDTFGESGNADALLVKYGLTAERIVEKCLLVLRRKR